MDINDQTPEGRQEILRRMREASSAFYTAATRCGCHAFIEFTGLMNEFIIVCAEAEKADVDWVHANGHGVRLPFESYQLQYVNEKLACIYGIELPVGVEPPIRITSAAPSPEDHEQR